LNENPLLINTTLARKVLVNFLRTEIHKVSFKKAILGVSGGVDSSLVAFLLVEAIGKENVIGACLPYKTIGKESIEDAAYLIRETGIRSITVDITESVDVYFKKFPAANQIRRGNKMARERMSVLFDLSAQEKALVIGTSNKTELLLGYGTWFGDTASSLNPIGDLYKTQVWQLSETMGVPKKIIEKVPTADLWTGQTDEGEMGIVYREADQILFWMVDKRLKDEQLLKKGFPQKKISKLRKMIQSSQYKRMLPVIAKLSSRTIGSDFRYPRDWGF
jgi:NAD+ synthase